MFSLNRRMLLLAGCSSIMTVSLPDVYRASAAEQEGQVALPNGVIAYKVIGSGSPIVLLAGGPGADSDYLMPVAQQLSQTHRVVLPEPRGMGASTLTRYEKDTLNFKLYVDDVEALRSSIGVDQWTVIGHSWGGHWALGYVADYPSHVKSLVIIDSGFPDPKTQKAVSADRSAAIKPPELEKIKYWSDPQRTAADPEKANLEIWKAFLPVFFVDKAKGDQFVREIQPYRFKAVVGNLMDADGNKAADTLPILRGSTIPALYIVGQQDLVGDSADQFKMLMPNLKVQTIAQSGHFPWIEQPEAFYAVLLGYLKDVGG